MDETRWDEIKNFTKTQFDCKYTGKNEMKHSFMLRLDQLATDCAFRIRISSGYRDISHPVEKAKDGATGSHPDGIAADLMVGWQQAFKVLEVAMRMGFTGIGIKQKGSKRFIHLDDSEAKEGRPRPHVWSY